MARLARLGFAFVFALFGGGVVLCAQTTILVPGDQPTIQQGIAAAANGDTVLVAPGTYLENIDFLGKAITVASSGGPGVTTIRGQGGPVVSFATFEGGDSVLAGFRVQGGDAVDGGGVWATLGAAPTLRECHVVGNTATDDGGGAFLPAAGTVERCLFVGNEAGDAGGGLIGGATVVDSTFLDNVAGGDGGGLFVSGNSVERCLFDGNEAAGDGGGLWADSYVFQFEVVDCAFLDNTATRGGGLWVARFDEGLIHGETDIRDSLFLDNHATQDGGGAWLFGSDFDFGGSQSNVTRCAFGGNTAGGEGGGLWHDGAPGRAVLGRLTLVGNGAVAAGDAVRSTSTGNSILANSVVWDGSAFAGNNLKVRNSDVQGGVVGAIDNGGNIDVDPLFLDAPTFAYALLPGSPCIGAGGDGQDMGAFDFGPWFDHGGALHGLQGRPQLEGTGPVLPASDGSFVLTGARPSGTTNLVLGIGYLGAPFKQGTLVPTPTFLIFGIPLDASGDVTLPFGWGAGLPTGVSVYVQCWTADDAGAAGYSASNGLSATGP